MSKHAHEKTAIDVLRERLAKSNDILRVMNDENLKIATYFYKFALILSEEYKDKKPLQEKLERLSKSKGGHISLSGFPGTLADAFKVLSDHFTFMNDSLRDMSKTIKDKSTELQTYPKPPVKASAEKTLTDATNPINDLVMTRQVYQKAVESADKKYVKAQEKINDTTVSLSKKAQEKITDKQKKPIVDNWPLILEAREKTDSHRILLLNKSNQALDKFKDNMNTFAKFSQRRIDVFRELFDVVMYAYMKVAATMQNAAYNIEQAAKAINPIVDMTNYAKSRRIVRYDLSIPKFEEFQCDSPVFRSIDISITSFITNYDPIGYAEIIHSFTAQNPNEINAVRGKRLLLLEHIHDDWTFVMHPVTHLTGFVPTNCIKPIGIALGVVLRKAAKEITQQVLLNPGEYVAVTSISPLCFETMRGEKLDNAPQNLVGVVYQDY